MPEYIERGALKEAFKSVTDDCTCPIHLAAEIDQILDQSPVADVAPVRHGQWEARAIPISDPDGDWIALEYHCSLCNFLEYRKENYCPNCGAKMGLK